MTSRSEEHGGPGLYLILGLGVLVVSSAAVLIRLADAPSLVIAAYRMALASLALSAGAAVVKRRRLAALRLPDLAWMVASGGFLALHFGFWITSLRFTSVASSVVLVTSNPLLVAVASWLLFREGVSRRELQGIALGLLGGVVVAAGDFRLGRDEFLGDLLALAGTVAVTGYLLIGRRTRAQESVFTYAAVVYPVAGVLLVVAALGSGSSLTGYSSATYLWLALVALVPQVVGHTSLNWALGYISATAVAIAVMGEPVLASLLAWLVLEETPPVASVIGGVLILVAVYLALHPEAD